MIALSQRTSIYTFRHYIVNKKAVNYGEYSLGRNSKRYDKPPMKTKKEESA
jgi:hypothetical protein